MRENSIINSLVLIHFKSYYSSPIVNMNHMNHIFQDILLKFTQKVPERHNPFCNKKKQVGTHLFGIFQTLISQIQIKEHRGSLADTINSLAQYTKTHISSFFSLVHSYYFALLTMTSFEIIGTTFILAIIGRNIYITTYCDRLVHASS